MREKRSKKRSKLRFLSNLKKVPIRFFKKWCENDGDSPRSNIGNSLCQCYCPKGGSGAKNVLNFVFCDAAGATNLKLGMAVTYII